MTTQEATHTNETLAADAVEVIDVHRADHDEDRDTPRVDESAQARRSARADEVAEAAGEIVGAAVEIGRAWARYGLQVSKLALETHARTMGNLAVAVGQAARAVEAVASPDEKA